MAKKNVRFTLFVAVIKSFEGKFESFFAIFDIAIALTTRFGAYRSRYGNFFCG